MAKRFTKPSINWAEFEKRVAPDQKTKFIAFKARSDGYLRRVLSNPPEPPAIDWEQYKKVVPIPGLVDNFKQQYEGFKVPYPSDTLTSTIDEQWTALQSEIKSFCADQQKLIEVSNKELARIRALPKFDVMTMEMAFDMYPESAIDSVKKPTFWPHNEEEQPWYKPPETPGAAKGH